MRQIDVNYFSAEIAISVDCLFDCGPHFIVQTFAEQGSRYAQAKAFLKVLFGLATIIRNRHIGSGRVVRIASRDCLHDRGGIARGPRKDTDLIQRRTKSDQAIARDSSIGWLESDYSAQRGRLTHRAAGV